MADSSLADFRPADHAHQQMPINVSIDRTVATAVTITMAPTPSTLQQD